MKPASINVDLTNLHWITQEVKPELILPTMSQINGDVIYLYLSNLIQKFLIRATMAPRA